MLIDDHVLPDEVVGPMTSIAATPGGLVIEVTGDNDMHGDGDDHFNEFLFAGDAFVLVDGSLVVHATEADAWPRRAATTPGPPPDAPPPADPPEPPRGWWQRLIG